MALNKEIWQSDIVENFYPDNSFASKSVDDSVFVENHKVHIPNAGAPSNVERNRTQKLLQASNVLTTILSTIWTS